VTARHVHRLRYVRDRDARRARRPLMLLDANLLLYAVHEDAQLAALAVEHGLTLCSADTDFARFTDLRWANPLS